MTAIQIRDRKSAGQPAAFRRLGVPESVVALMFAPSQPDDASEASTGFKSAGHDRYVRLTDQEWAVLEPFIPDAAQAQIPARDFLDGVLWRLVNARPWGAIPRCYGQGDAIRNRLSRLARTGALDLLAEKLRGKLSTQRQDQIKSLGDFAAKVARRWAKQRIG